MRITYHLMGNGRVKIRAARQYGTIAILFAILLAMMIGFCGLALDLGRVYNRKVEMQNVADTIALAAAAQLDGTAAGITAALDAAATRMTAGAPQHLTYQYSRLSMDWADAAIGFGIASNGPWLDSNDAKATPEKMMFVRVNTANLDASYGRIDTLFIRVIDDKLKTVNTSASAIAGRSTVNAVPLAVCAMRPEAALNRTGELVEYGFRRGISYDLMRLNADSELVAGVKTFLINPFAPAGTTGESLNPSNLSPVKPYVCTGSLAIPNLTNGQITVESQFPLSTFYTQLNSRFDTYAAPCTANSAPPDANVKVYQKGAGTWLPWLGASAQPFNQSATEYSDSTLKKYWTVADSSPSPGTTVDRDYGPLWQYARPVKWSAYVPGTLEPATGYIYTSLFNPSDWATLYTPGKPVVKAGTYPNPTKLTDPRTPYEATTTAPPSGRKGVRNRRVLNVPLLQCPVAGNTATVLGIGKFFMTVPATATTLYAEFAGAAPSASVGGQVELYP